MTQPHHDRQSPASTQPGPSTEAPGAKLPEPAKGDHAPRPGDLTQSNVNLASGKPSTSPDMPHERDETAGMTDGKPDPRVEQAFTDLKKGRQDTSRGAESDAAYQRQKRD